LVRAVRRADESGNPSVKGLKYDRIVPVLMEVRRWKTAQFDALMDAAEGLEQRVGALSRGPPLSFPPVDRKFYTLVDEEGKNDRREKCECQLSPA
jgi:hypothetical protein